MLYECSRLRGYVQFTYLDQITDGPGSTIRDCSRIVSAILSIRWQIHCNKIGRLVNDLMWIFPRDRKSGRC